MTSILWVLFLLMVLNAGSPRLVAVATEPRKPFILGVTESRYLPPAMYGQWSMTATLLSTNAPDYFSPLIHDIWMLEQTGNQVVISNPSNGASAAITIDQVQGSTATFHRVVSESPSQRFIETPTVKVNADSLIGQTRAQVVWIKNGQATRSISALYRLVGERVSGPGVRFGQDRNPPPKEFEIEEIRPLKK